MNGLAGCSCPVSCQGVRRYEQLVPLRSPRTHAASICHSGSTRPCLVVVLSEPYTARFGESFQFEGVLALLLDSGERPAGDVSPWNVSWFSKKSGSRRIA